jgi:tRNA pseudouridine55 synthase
MDGIILIDKPSGWTSFDVVAKIRGIVRKSNSQIVKLSDSQEKGYKTIGLSDFKTPLQKVKVGHTGTLDPLATGLMIVVLGSYTKRAQEFSKLDKTYEVTAQLGQTSTTADEEGEKTAVNDRVPSPEEIRSTLDNFVGEILQTPPIYSAMKINGQRAYKLARAGKEVKLEPRPVTIYALELTDYTYPDLKFTAQVSSGTYIRSLVTDIGDALKTGAYMSALRRTQVGTYQIQNALPAQSLNYAELAKHTKIL